MTDYRGTLRDLGRPMPERPYTQTRIGTLFHAWVEHRSGLVGAGPSAESALWELDEDMPDVGAMAPTTGDDEQALAGLRAIFERSEWADLQPIAVEIEIDFAFGPSDSATGTPPTGTS